ncbi:hypothetical protein HW532_19175 [Kaustia mangrovi]|uniref:Uncharacterized protein n=1 Tax=Kaustia mangrovi TaxID=2593653 RepID=A0A7S8C748_9HYPH|nr:hypothetical protein [Kaustia mangrovi]QPC44635.1 hypothetical protein HW532_19175 [Kaustia mangrovi]
MPNDFYVMRVQSRIGTAKYNVRLEIQPDDATDVDPTPRRDLDGAYVLPIVQPSDNERHIVLGKFMDEWSKLEMALSFLLGHLTSTPMESVSVLMNALGSRGQLDVMRTLAPLRIEGGKVGELEALLDRVKAQNTRRNRIVHGYWALELVVVDCDGAPAIRYHQYREYFPSDAETKIRIGTPSNRKVRSKYLFGLGRIKTITRNIIELRRDLEAFKSRCLPSGQ